MNTSLNDSTISSTQAPPAYNDVYRQNNTPIIETKDGEGLPQIHIHNYVTSHLPKSTESKESEETKEETPVVAKNWYVKAETFLGQYDRYLVVSIISGLARLAISVIQFFHAVLNVVEPERFTIVDGENYFKHAGLNLVRSLAALIPVIGNVAIAVYDAKKIRACYEFETVKEDQWHLFCKQDNYESWAAKKEPDEFKIDDPTGFDSLTGLPKKAVEGALGL